MANLRIRELDTVTVGTGGTAADAVYLVVDPSSGGTGKVSLESAVAGTNIIANAESALGAPLISNGAGGRRTHAAYVINNLFATNTTVFGNIWYYSKGGRTGWSQQGDVTISKSKGSNTVFVSNGAGDIQNADGKSKNCNIVSGTPKDGRDYSNQLTASHGDKQFNHRVGSGRYGFHTLISLWLHTNGFYVGSQTQLRWHFMYWPTS
jgi:hypothetical protein